MSFRTPLAAAVVATLLVAAPVHAAPPGPKTQVWIDVATHEMAGMPDLGGLGRFASAMSGGKTVLDYPDARTQMSTGQYFDIALYNGLAPGREAQQLVPSGLGLGKSLPLLPPQRQVNPESDETPGVPEGDIRILYYWGCGADVRKGQPKVFTASVRGGKVQTSGTPMSGRFAPNRDVRPDPSYALWPNPKARKRAGNGASLQGEHRITGDGVPESLKFTLTEQADFMPRIGLTQEGSPASGPVLRWPQVARARAYFLHAVAMQGKDVVIWSSADVPEAGSGLVDFLQAGNIDRWLKEKVLLPTSTTSCQIPKGILKDGGESGAGLLSMIAYGPETHITWPPKPADPKQPWAPEWNVRVRTKSTAGAILGMDMSGMGMGAADDADSGEEGEPAQEEEGGAKKLMRGLFRRF